VRRGSFERWRSWRSGPNESGLYTAIGGRPGNCETRNNDERNDAQPRSERPSSLGAIMRDNDLAPTAMRSHAANMAAHAFQRVRLLARRPRREHRRDFRVPAGGDEGPQAPGLWYAWFRSSLLSRRRAERADSFLVAEIADESTLFIGEGKRSGPASRSSMARVRREASSLRRRIAMTATVIPQPRSIEQIGRQGRLALARPTMGAMGASGPRGRRTDASGHGRPAGKGDAERS
jgi:hypothetical protein